MGPATYRGVGVAIGWGRRKRGCRWIGRGPTVAAISRLRHTLAVYMLRSRSPTSSCLAIVTLRGACGCPSPCVQVFTASKVESQQAASTN
jgi:hypothetical protein